MVPGRQVPESLSFLLSTYGRAALYLDIASTRNTLEPGAIY